MSTAKYSVTELSRMERCHSAGRQSEIGATNCDSHVPVIRAGRSFAGHETRPLPPASAEVGSSGTAESVPAATGEPVVLSRRTVSLDSGAIQTQQPFFRRAETEKLTQAEKVVSKLIPVYISDSRRSASEFWDLFKSLGSRNNMIFLGVNNGMSMLHQIAFQGRVDFLGVLFNLGIWSNLIGIRTEGGAPEHHNLTVMEMAQKMNKASIWAEMDRLNREEESLNELHKAARIGNWEEIDILLGSKFGSYVNLSSMYGKTPLYWAATSGDYDVMHKLIEAGADTSFQTEDGDTLLTRLVKLNYLHLVKRAIDELRLDIEQHGLNGESPLYIASKNGHEEIFYALLNAGATLSGLSLTGSAVSGKIKFMTTLIDRHKLHPNWQDIMGKTPFHAAATAGQVGSMDLLIKNGADVTATDKRKRNLLHFAVEGGSEAALKRAIEIFESRKQLKEFLNAQDVFSEMELILLVKGKIQGQPVWHYMLANRTHYHILREKVRGGPIDVNDYESVIKSGWGESPTQADRDEIERKYSPDKIPPTAPADMTPLMLAIMKEKHSLVAMLLKEKPELEIQDSYGLTAIHLACMKGNIDIVKSLVSAGSKTGVRDKGDRTPLQVAKENGQSVVATFLEDRNYIEKINDFDTDKLVKALRYLHARALNEKLNNGVLKDYSVGVLRELSSDIDSVLYELGTAPIGQVLPDD